MNENILRKAIRTVAESVGDTKIRQAMLKEAAEPGIMQRIMPWTQQQSQPKPAQQPRGRGLWDIMKNKPRPSAAEEAMFDEELQRSQGIGTDLFREDEQDDLLRDVPDMQPMGEEVLQEPMDDVDQQVKGLGVGLWKWMTGMGINPTKANELIMNIETQVRQELLNRQMPPTTRVQSLDKAIVDLTKLADMADAQGLIRFASNIDALLPRMSIVKLAQYEGVQHYHLMNSRAFEKAWREKRKKKASDDSQYHLDEKGYYKSANECWWETLEEYQDSLFGNHEEWLKKHAFSNANVVTAKGKKKKDDKEEESASGTASPGATMSGPMSEEAKKRKDGKGIQEWLDNGGMPLPAYQKAFGIILMEKVAERMDAGSPAGVAFFEAMDYMASPDMPKDVIRNVLDAVDTLKTAATDKGDAELQKAAQQWIGRGLNMLGDAWDWGKQKVTDVKDWGKEKMDNARMFDEIQPLIAQVEQTLYMMKQNPQGAAAMMKQLNQQTQQLGAQLQLMTSPMGQNQQPQQQNMPPQTQVQEAPQAKETGPYGVPTLPFGQPAKPQGVNTLPFPA